MFRPVQLAEGLRLHAPALTEETLDVLTPEAAALVVRLHRALAPERARLLAARRERQAQWDAGAAPGYLPLDEVPAAYGDWQVAPLPADLQRRRVEITGPASDARMVINMLTRGADGQRADAAMLDLEDSMMPSWGNVMAAVANARAAAEGTLTAEKRGPDGTVLKHYRLDPEDMPVLMVRVRGLHLDESNVQVDGETVAAGLFDLALVALHTAKTLVAQGKTPAFYVPKVEHYAEARWWARLFALVEGALGLAPRTIRATFLIETLPAAFQMEEILYELRDYAAGLNVGRWDKIFSDIKCLQAHPDRVVADRATIGLGRPWMRAYAERLVRICHRHGALAMGGMAAFTPGRDEEARAAQTAKVVADKELEAALGHDGCWVSHPYFIGPALGPFEAALAGRDNQLDVMPEAVERPDLLLEGGGPRTLDGLLTNVRVGIAYLKGWQEGLGCVAFEGLMEDLATLEISRVQVGQWLLHGVRLDGHDGPATGPTVTPALVRHAFAEELDSLLHTAPATEHGAWRRAAAEAERVFLLEPLRSFLTLASPLAEHSPAAVAA